VRVIDSSSLLHGWDDYPISNFPRLWEWMASEVAMRSILVPRVVLEEIERICQDCRQWVGEVDGFTAIEIDNSIVSEAIAIASWLGVDNDQYGSGVGANDILIIATAKSLGCPLVSNEAKQLNLPNSRKKYKIPAVCAASIVGIDCISFADLIRASGRVF
jgi:hypothetical protein